MKRFLFSSITKTFSFFTLVFVCQANLVSAQNCDLMGYWKTLSAGDTIFLDINKEQILFINSNGADCDIFSYVAYKYKNDSLFYLNTYTEEGKPVILITEFLTCDSLKLTYAEEYNTGTSNVTLLKRLKGHECDYPKDYYIRDGRGRRSSRENLWSILFLIFYIPTLIIWIIFFFRKRERDLIWFLLVLICLVFSILMRDAIYLLFTIHSCIWVKYKLQSIKVINSLGRVILYGLFAGVVIMLEYFLLFGADDTYIHSYTTLIPLLSNGIGLTLVYQLYTEGRIFADRRTSIIASLLALFLPQILLFSYREEVFTFFNQFIIQ